MSGSVARWEVPLNDGKTHIIEFEHGTATGKRVVKVNGKTMVNKEWMFRLVGDEIIHLGKNKIVIRVDPIPDKNSQTLWINGINEVDIKNEFVDGGAEMSFTIGGLPAVIRSNNLISKEITYILYIDDLEIKDQDISE